MFKTFRLHQVPNCESYCGHRCLKQYWNQAQNQKKKRKEEKRKEKKKKKNRRALFTHGQSALCGL